MTQTPGGARVDPAPVLQVDDVTGEVITGGVRGGSGGANVHNTPATAPTDANLKPGQISWYLDEAGNNLKARVKYSNGTLKTATIALV
jgi:hypothetical protein